MPRRTNSYQKLVALIQQALAPVDAKVTESAMATARGLDGFREVDVLVEAPLGPYQMKIAVEAKDHKRKLNVVDIETIAGKYRGAGRIVVDKVVLVARQGFSRSAFAKAELQGIELLTLKEAERVDWLGDVEPRFSSGIVRPALASVSIEPPLSAEIGNRPYTDGRIICHCPKCRGKDKGSPREYADRVFVYRFWLNPSWQRQMRAQAEQKKGSIMLELDIPLEHAALQFGEDQFNITRIKARTERFDPATFPALSPSFTFLRLEVPPHITRVDFEPPIPVKDLESLFSDGRLLCVSCNRDHGELGAFVQEIMEKRLFAAGSDFPRQLQTEAAERGGGVSAQVVVPMANRRLSYQGSVYPLQRMTVHIQAFAGEAPLRFKTYELSGDSVSENNIQCGETFFDKLAVRMVLPKGLLSDKIVLDIESDDWSDGEQQVAP